MMVGCCGLPFEDNSAVQYFGWSPHYLGWGLLEIKIDRKLASTPPLKNVRFIFHGI